MLLTRRLSVSSPNLLYPVIYISDGSRQIMAVYQPEFIVELGMQANRIDLVNATQKSTLLLSAAGDANYHALLL